MNKDKLKNLEYKAFINTIEIRSSEFINEEINKKFLLSVDRNCKNATEMIYKASLSPNIYAGKEITTYSEFTSVFNRILTDLNIKNYVFNKVNFVFDLFETNDFDKYFKLNNLLLMLLSIRLDTKTNYLVQDLFSPNKISISIKNSSVQVENYNKNYDTNGLSPISSRLEFRKLRLRDFSSDIKELSNYWCNALNALPNLTDELSARINSILVDYYIQHKNAKQKRFISENDFIMQNENKIYSKKQLIDLFEKMGVANADKKATNFKQFYGIEYFDKSDLRIYVNVLCKSIKNYFEN